MCGEICTLLPSTCTLEILLELESRLSPPHSSLLFLIISPFLLLFCILKEIKARMQNSQIVPWTAPHLCCFTSTFPPSGHRTLALYCTGLFCKTLQRGNPTSLRTQQAWGQSGKKNRSSKWNLVISQMFKKNLDSEWCEWYSVAGQHGLTLYGDQVLH